MDQRYRVLRLGIKVACLPAVTLILRYCARPPTSVNGAPVAVKTHILGKLATEVFNLQNISIKILIRHTNLNQAPVLLLEINAEGLYKGEVKVYIDATFYSYYLSYASKRFMDFVPVPSNLAGRVTAPSGQFSASALY